MACVRPDGNVYFSDMGKSTILGTDAASGVEPFIENVPNVSGTKWSPDGRLICCQGGTKRIIAFDKDKKLTAISMSPAQMI